MTKKKPLPPLTEKEKKVLDYIESYILGSGISPSYQEIKDHFGFASFNSIQNYLKQLLTKGYIAVEAHQKRAITVLHPSSAVQSALQSQAHSSSLSQSVSTVGSPNVQLLQAREEILSIPLLGKVAAGRPIEALSHDEFVEAPRHMIKDSQNSFALKVQGNSMIEDGILNGDIILIHSQKSAKNGDIVVATVDNEATVKRIYLGSRPGFDRSEKWVELRPSNSEMESMWYNPDQVEMRGIVTGLLRSY